jgi:hypothetical protein
MRNKLISAALALALAASSFALAAVSAPTAEAAPITCPSNQDPVKTSSGWKCQNPSGNTSGAAKTKNPNTK